MSVGLGQQGYRREISAAATATFFLLLGLGVVWFARKVADVNDGAVLASFVIVPALLYVVLRGGLAELRGPGGWQATFVRVATSQVNAAGERLDVTEDVQVIEKETMSGLTNRVNALALDQPVLMTMTLGTRYTDGDVSGYLKTLGQFPRFRLVALLNDAGRFIGCISPAELAGLMRSQALSDGFLNAIAGGNEPEVNKTDDKDAVLIARLTSQLRCYIPEPVDETWGRLRHLGARREQLIVEASSQVQQIRALLECVWPASLDAAQYPFRSKTWAAAMTVIMGAMARRLARRVPGVSCPSEPWGRRRPDRGAVVH